MREKIYGILQGKSSASKKWIDIEIFDYFYLGIDDVFYAWLGLDNGIDIEPILKPKGLPKDLILNHQNMYRAAFKTQSGSRMKFDVFLGNHTYSWVIAEDVLNAPILPKDKTNPYINFLIYSIKSFCRDYDNIRFVYGFSD